MHAVAQPLTFAAANGLTSTVQTGPLVAAAGVALLVGVVGFLSPCVLPLVPGYLAYVGGLSGEPDARPSQRRMALGALLFVVGFTIIFVAQGVFFGQFGASVREHNTTLQRVAGILTILLGIVFLGGFGFLQREFKIHRMPRGGLIGAPLLGAGFGLAWTPCLTPTFAAVYDMSAVAGTAGRGALLTVCYCLGLGVPFILVALGFGWVTKALGFVRKHRRIVSGAGGLLLVVIGVLLVTGQWNNWMSVLHDSFSSSGVQI